MFKYFPEPKKLFSHRPCALISPYGNQQRSLPTTKPCKCLQNDEDEKTGYKKRCVLLLKGQARKTIPAVCEIGALAFLWFVQWDRKQTIPPPASLPSPQPPAAMKIDLEEPIREHKSCLMESFDILLWNACFFPFLYLFIYLFLTRSDLHCKNWGEQ